tara:strand:+ start:648 stop:833 length:186 start_codon:yes stop_codon:yes gene_type:complete
MDELLESFKKILILENCCEMKEKKRELIVFKRYDENKIVNNIKTQMNHDNNKNNRIYRKYI